MTFSRTYLAASVMSYTIDVNWRDVLGYSAKNGSHHGRVVLSFLWTFFAFVDVCRFRCIVIWHCFSGGLRCDCACMCLSYLFLVYFLYFCDVFLTTSTYHHKTVFPICESMLSDSSCIVFISIFETGGFEGQHRKQNTERIHHSQNNFQ